MSLPVYPVLFVIFAAIASGVAVVQSRAIPILPLLWRAVLCLTLFATGLHVWAAISGPAQSPLRGVDAAVEVNEHAESNLLANTDISGLQVLDAQSVWSPYVEYAYPGVWTVQRAVGSPAVKEIRTVQEIPIAAGVAYHARVFVRQADGAFSGQIIFRTRHGWESASHTTEKLANGWSVLTGVLPAADSAGRLRALHLVDNSGHWTKLEIGFASVVPEGQQTDAFVPAFRMNYPVSGVLWWLGLLTLLTVSALPFISGLSKKQAAFVSNGLVLGL